MIANLTFISCVQKHNSKAKSGRLETLFFNKCMNISFLSVTLLGSVNSAFFILDTNGNITIDNVVVANTNTAGQALGNIGTGIAFSKCGNSTAHLSITNSRFINNTNYARFPRQLLAAGGLTLEIRCPNVTVKIFNLTMSNNTGYMGGNFAVFTSPKYMYHIEIANSMFERGRAAKGAGMYIILGAIKLKHGECKDVNTYQNEQLHVYNSSFTNNVAEHYGGGVCIEQKETLMKCNIMVPSVITFEKVNFAENALQNSKTVISGGIAFHSMSWTTTDYIYHGNPQFKVTLNHCSIHDNYIKLPKNGESETGVVFVVSNHLFNITNIAIFNNKATGILGMRSNIILSQNVTISNNNGSLGGGMLLCQNAVMYLEAHTNVTIANNRAVSIGAGISVETYYLGFYPKCFFQLGYEPLQNNSLQKTITISIYNNSAGFAGNNIFGGSIQHCYMNQGERKSKHKQKFNVYIFNKIFNVTKNTINLSSISSPPHFVCLCQDKMKPNCKKRNHSLFNKFPGETFSIDAVLVGQYDGTVPGTVEANLTTKHSSLKQGERVQKISSTVCYQLNYTIHTNSHHEVLELRVQHIGDVKGYKDSNNFNNFIIDVTFRDCPFGFTLSKDNCNYSITIVLTN